MTGASLRDRVVYAVKWGVAQALDTSGLLALKRRMALRRRAVVLVYHRLLPPGTETWSHPGIVVTPATFERHMRLLQREFNLLTLEAFERHLATGTPFEPASCLVTFDDGWVDTYTEAWPILRALGVPAVVFLPTRYIGSNETFWQEQLGMLLWQAAMCMREEPDSRARVLDALRSCGLEDVFDRLVDGDRPAILQRVRDLKSDGTADPGDAAACLARTLGPRASLEPIDRFMTWDQVREMARDGLRFGVHGHTHRILTTLSGDEVSRELCTARAAIERETGVPVSAMSYPNGNWSPQVADEVRAQRFGAAFSMDRGHAEAGDSAYSIRRMNIHEDLTGTDAFFRARILGVL